MIDPNVIIYQQRSSEMTSRESLNVLDIPVEVENKSQDARIIDQIRNQPKPNEIGDKTESVYKTDIQQMVKLLGSYCQINSIQEIAKVIKEIHDTLNQKDAPEVKDWVRLTTSLHPEIDNQIKEYGYWKMPFSEMIGTNTILYYAGPDSIDITFWAKAPMFTTNEVKWFLTPWSSPQYIRESTRHKLDSAIVEMIQNAHHTTTQYMRRNLIFEALQTTEKLTGAEKRQKRPIEPIVPDINHGVSLNNDWYHQKYRIMDGTYMNKNFGKHDALYHLTEKGFGYYVHLMINHLTPLLNASVAQAHTTDLAGLGVEDTFPRRKAKQPSVDFSGQIVFDTPTDVNNDVLKPEIIQGE